MASIITNFQSPQTLDELEFCYEDDMRSNLDFILNEPVTVWTVDKRSKKGDSVFFNCATSAKSRIGSVCKAVKSTGNQELIDFAEKERELYKKYSGHIVAYGILIDDAFFDEDDNRWSAEIEVLSVFENPIPYSEYKTFAPVSSYGAITILSDEQSDKIKNITETYNPLVEEQNDLENDLESTVIVPDRSLPEGKRIEVYGTKYERNPKIRKAFLALQKKPYQCSVCGFDYEKCYGELGKDYIEVHHKTPLSVNKKEINVDIKNDLVCLCANCHRMIHRKKGAVMSVEDLKKCIKKA